MERDSTSERTATTATPRVSPRTGGDDGDGGGATPTTVPSAVPLQRRTSGTDYSTSAMKFLRVVNKIQKIKRMDRAYRQHSAPALFASSSNIYIGPNNNNNNNRASALNETSPLLQATKAPTDATVSSSFHDPQQQQQQQQQQQLSDSHRSAVGANRSPSSPSPPSPWKATCVFCKDLIFGKGIISVCLLAAPLALLSVHLQWNATSVFWLNFIVMIPLASILGDFTEEVALHTNQTIGGLINATFGNAVEVVVALQALAANEIRVVQSSMLGSIFSNLLLVLGGCFFFGGLKYKEQTFNTTAATANMALLALSGIALVLPTPFASYYELHDQHVLFISRLAAIFLLFMYLQLLVFQLKTHADLFEDGGTPNIPAPSSTLPDTSTTNTPANAPETDDNTNDTTKPQGGNGGGDAVPDSPPPPAPLTASELASIPFGVACLGLLVTTFLVTFFSEFLVYSIDGFVEDSGISRTFVGIILLPIVGNAVEHVTAITVARKDKMDLAMGVAVGSCTQISLFVVPLTVLVGWAMDRDMTLNFPHFEIILFVMSVFTVSIVLSSPKCNWLEGSLLMTTYLLIAVGFWFENITSYDETGSSSSSSGSNNEMGL
ncbi:hypothetical protein ACA910_004830 [Epithemia clementina (nom. ined.)]